MKKQTQCEAILAYLRKHKRATNMDLMQKLWISSPHKRISDMISWGNGLVDWNCGGKLKRGPFGIEHMTERITRRFIRTPGGKRVVLYELVKA